MEGYLQWKVVAPDYNNPFKPPVPEHVLRALVQHRTSLRRVCGVRCLCDGFELMSMENLDTPSINTDHPCISALGVNKVLDYVGSSEVNAAIERQLDRIAQHIEELLEERARTYAFDDEVEWEEYVTIRELRERREKQKTLVRVAAGGFKIRYDNSGGHSPFGGLAY